MDNSRRESPLSSSSSSPSSSPSSSSNNHNDGNARTAAQIFWARRRSRPSPGLSSRPRTVFAIDDIRVAASSEQPVTKAGTRGTSFTSASLPSPSLLPSSSSSVKETTKPPAPVTVTATSITTSNATASSSSSESLSTSTVLAPLSSTEKDHRLQPSSSSSSLPSSLGETKSRATSTTTHHIHQEQEKQRIVSTSTTAASVTPKGVNVSTSTATPTLKKRNIKRTPRKLINDLSVPTVMARMRLAHPDDEQKVNALHCFVRSELLEVYVVNTNDCENSNSKINNNIVGIRCTQCGFLPKKERGKGFAMSTFFPKSVEDIYSGVCGWQRIHFPVCRHMPKELKDRYKDCKERNLKRGKKAHWIHSAYALGLRNVDSERSGVTYQPDSNENLNVIGNYHVAAAGTNAKTNKTTSSSLDTVPIATANDAIGSASLGNSNISLGQQPDSWAEILEANVNAHPRHGNQCGGGSTKSIRSANASASSSSTRGQGTSNNSDYNCRRLQSFGGETTKSTSISTTATTICIQQQERKLVSSTTTNDARSTQSQSSGCSAVNNDSSLPAQVTPPPPPQQEQQQQQQQKKIQRHLLNDINFKPAAAVAADKTEIFSQVTPQHPIVAKSSCNNGSDKDEELDANQLEEKMSMRKLQNGIDRDEQQQRLRTVVSSEGDDQDGFGKSREAVIDDNDTDDADSDNLDGIASMPEEQYVLRRLMQKVEAAEDVDYYTEMHPSLLTTAISTSTFATNTAIAVGVVEEGGGNGESRVYDGSSGGGSWKMIRSPHLRLPAWGRAITTTTTTRSGGTGSDDSQKAGIESKVTGMSGIIRRRIRQILPKWIPNESGGYSNDSSSLLFTRPQFIQNVIVEAEKIINGLHHEHHAWKATLSSNHPSEPYSYLLEAEGTEEALKILRDEAKKFVTAEIERINLTRLVDDDESLVVDVTWVVDLNVDLAKRSLDARFSTVHVADKEGAYIKAIHPDGALAKALGNREAYGRGCALLAVNKKEIANPSEIEDIVIGAKTQCTRTSSIAKIKLTICLSKYADLSDAPNLFKMKIRRRDGLPYDAEFYENLRFNRNMELSRRHSRDQVEEENEEFVDECPFPKPLSTRKRRNQRKEESNEEKAKRRKKVPREEKSDSECDTNIETFTVVDEAIDKGEKEKIKRRRKVHREEKSDSECDTNIETFTVVDEAIDKGEKEKIKRRKKVPREEKSDSECDTNTETFTVVDEAIDKGEKEKIKRTANEGIKRFWVFERKIKPLITLDYKDTKINIKNSCSSMWKKHKELFGEDVICGEDCRCILWLPELVENVIKDHVVRQKKKKSHVETEQELEKRTCGISKYFAPRFVPLLEKEYPTDTESQLINRLVEMWESHQMNRMYGMRCKEGCVCEGEWDQIFGKGDKSKAKEFVASMKRSSLLSQRMTSSVSQKEVLAGPVIPRKKRAPASSHDQQYNTNNGSKKRKISGLISSMSSRVELYEVVFDSSTALGGYFRTESLSNGTHGTRCQVYSKYLMGQMAKDPRVTNGTTVVSVITGETRNKISSHTELKQFYDNAKRTRSRLCILFENENVKPGTDNNFNKDSWDESGNWIGTAYLDEDDGWAGGAVTVQRLKSMKPVANTGSAATSAEDTVGGMKEQMGTNYLAIPEWTTIINTTEPGHRYNKHLPNKPLIGKKSSFPPEEPGDSTKDSSTSGRNIDRPLSQFLPPRIQKSKRERTHSKKVVISIPNNEEFFFCKDEASNVRRVLAKPQVQTNQISPQLPPKETLINAIQKKSCKDVIEFLEAGAIEDINDIESVLQEEYTFVGNELQKINKLAGSPTVMAQKNDLSAKYRVLSIYINCMHLIEKTMSLKKWYALDIELRYIDLQQNHTIVEMVGGEVAVKLQNGNIKEDFGPLPIRKFAQHICYSDSDSPLVYTVHNNSNFRFDQRDFIIDLKKGSPQDSVATGRRLGSFNLMLNDIEQKCTPNGTPIDYTQSLSNNSVEELSSGVATISATKRIAEKEYIMIKKQDVMKKLNLQLEYIKRFNQDPKTPTDAKLTANIIGIGGKSILHAAVLLMDDKDLVEKMLRLGADPRISSHIMIGTPLSLAQRNFHLASEKEKNIRRIMEEKKKQNVDIDLHEKRCNQARMLVEMLQNNVIEPYAAPAELPVATSKKSLDAREDKHSQSDTTKPLAAPTEVFPKRSLYKREVNHSQSGRTETNDVSSLGTPRRQLDTREDNHSPSGTTDTHARSSLATPMRKFDAREGNHSFSGTAETNAASPLGIPRRRSDTRKEDQSFTGTDLVPQCSSSPNPILPILKSVNWVIYNKYMRKKCNLGLTCKFFKQGICKYWHDAIGLLPHKQRSIPSSSLCPLDQLPTLSEDMVKFKKEITSETWWTAAFVDMPSHTVIYAQKALESSGHISDDGISWFRLKEDALISLRYTVFIRKNESNNQQPSGGIGNYHNQNQNQSHHRQPRGVGNHQNQTHSHYQQEMGGYNNNYNHNQSQSHYQHPSGGQNHYNKKQLQQHQQQQQPSGGQNHYNQKQLQQHQQRKLSGGGQNQYNQNQLQLHQHQHQHQQQHQQQPSSGDQNQYNQNQLQQHQQQQQRPNSGNQNQYNQNRLQQQQHQQQPSSVDQNQYNQNHLQQQQHQQQQQPSSGGQNQYNQNQLQQHQQQQRPSNGGQNQYNQNQSHHHRRPPSGNGNGNGYRNDHYHHQNHNSFV